MGVLLRFGFVCISGSLIDRISQFRHHSQRIPILPITITIPTIIYTVIIIALFTILRLICKLVIVIFILLVLLVLLVLLILLNVVVPIEHRVGWWYCMRLTNQIHHILLLLIFCTIYLIILSIVTIVYIACIAIIILYGWSVIDPLWDGTGADGTASGLGE